MSWTIYCHTHIATGRRYIGQTMTSMVRRWRVHVRDAQKPSSGWFFASAIRKYGPDSFAHEVLEICETLESANAAEDRWIVHFDTRNPDKGFNLRRGGERKRITQTQAVVRAKMGAGSKARWDSPEGRAKVLAAQSAPEARAKQSEAAKARWKDPEYRAKVLPGIIAQTHSSEAVAKAAAAKRKPWSQERRVQMTRPEVLAKLAAAARAQWQDPAARERKVRGILASKASVTG
jgi:group I intron endonuclease